MSLQSRLTADLASKFFSTSNFAVAATYTPKGGSAKTINVIFRAAFKDQTLEQLQVDTQDPYADCISTDVTGAQRGDTLLVNSTTYNVKEVQLSARGYAERTRLMLTVDSV